ncbi:transcriptional regulator [Aquipseudomonas alcaligenes]|uniref:winged helix-turn-helix domain-containing protein n=1 Tax=Aquipseudomonas alcaligenes TaxID=43263 RepID=UPI00374847A3
MSTYVINDLIRFDNEAFVLYAATEPEETLRIGAIASRCLTQLLEANGEIVSKRDLMAGAWGAFGLEVTDNSLAQVVRQLRVAMEKLQPGHELIVTVPRIGYKISEQVTLLDPPSPATPDLALTPASEAAREPAGSAPAPMHERRAPVAARDLLLGLVALACWIGLFFLPGLLWPVSLPERPFAEQRVEDIDGVRVHLENMPASALRPDNRQLVAHAKQLGQTLAMDVHKLHIYRFADQYLSLDLLCEGTLLAPGSQCLGVQAHD